MDEQNTRYEWDYFFFHNFQPVNGEATKSVDVDFTQFPAFDLDVPVTRTNADPTLTVFHEPSDVEHLDR